MGTRVEYLDRQYHPTTRRYPPPRAKTSHTEKPPAIKFTARLTHPFIFLKWRTTTLPKKFKLRFSSQGYFILEQVDLWQISSHRINHTPTRYHQNGVFPQKRKGTFQQEAKLLASLFRGDQRDHLPIGWRQKEGEEASRHLEGWR